VTGAASGIGRATALAFASAGAHVVVADVSAKMGKETLDQVQVRSPKSLFVECDVSSNAHVENLVKETVKVFGRIDCAFNNAGTEGQSVGIAQMSEEQWDRVIDTNLKGVWLCMKHELLQMQKQGAGAIVNCASVAGLVGFSGASAYTASKHGIVGLTKAGALEYAKSNIRINAVCPGVIETPMIDRAVEGHPQMKSALISGEPIGRLGTPMEIANAVMWLCSDAASFVIGQAIAVDGGWVAQ
jgi:NAD(P)-dependent dehydrogenase (short-subunit alcohol dehydrogenase family)